MKIEDLSKKSGVGEQSIYRYIRVGLLPKPTKIGFRQTTYNDGHLQLLKKVRQLRDEEGLSLLEIKKLLDVGGLTENETMASPQIKKDQIMDTAILLFSKNGFENTKISDITDELKVSKGAFYLYFKSKRDLFIECIGRLTMIIIPKESWEQVRQERDFIERQRIKLTIFLREFPTFSGILNLARLSFESHDAVIAMKARDSYRILTQNLEKDLRRAIRDGVAHEVDTDAMSFLLFGMAEGLGHKLMMDSHYTLEEAVEMLLGFLRRTFLSIGADKAGTGTQTRQWLVKDSKGFTTPVENICFNGGPQLSGIIGEGKLNINMANVSSIKIQESGTQLVAAVNTPDRGAISLNVDEKMVVSGECEFGRYEIPLEKVSEICLIPENDNGC